MTGARERKRFGEIATITLIVETLRDEERTFNFGERKKAKMREI